MTRMKTPFQRAQLIALKKLGLSDRAVAKQLGNIDHTTVNRIWRRYSLGLEFLTRKPGSGRHRALSLSDKHWASLLLARGLARTASDLQRRFFPHVSIDTVRRRLHELNLKVYKRRRVPYLSTKARARRWKWARVFSSWNKMNWAHVTFSDESKYVIFDSDALKITWKVPGAPPKPSDVRQAIKYGGGSVMVWGFITCLGPGCLYRIEGKMNTAKYIEALSYGYLRTLPIFGLRPSDLIFQHDNDPKHTSQGTTKWLIEHKIRVLPWPSSSPDMNPIEHVWAYLDQQLRSRPILPTNREELWKALQEEWEQIPIEFITKLYDSMPDRVNTLLKAKGGHTPY
jgi:transposase